MGAGLVASFWPEQTLWRGCRAAGMCKNACRCRPAYKAKCDTWGAAWLQGGGDVQDRPCGWSLLHLAAALGHAAALAVLLSHGAPAAGRGAHGLHVHQCNPVMASTICTLAAYTRLAEGDIK